MKKVRAVLESLKAEEIRSWKEFPDIMLYMDQVLILLEDQVFFKEKQIPLSASMVNNYVKSGLLSRAEKKKYHRGHLARLSMISVLKQVISLKEMESFFRHPREEEQVYTHYHQLLHANKEEVLREIEGMDREELILHLILKSYLYKILAEELLRDED